MSSAGDLGIAIGDTPLVRLRRVMPERAGTVLVKLESGNPTGSYKDRMAVSVIRGAMTRGELNPGDRVVEYTGGSTGMALAFVCARLGLGFTAVSSDAFSETKLASMRAYGADVLIEPSGDGAITPELIVRMRERALALAGEPRSFYADQFGSADVRAGYRPMGREIAKQITGAIDVLCAGVGTAAALMGTADGLAANGHEPDVIALEPAQSPLLTTGTGGPHRVEGIGVGFAPPFLERGRLSGIRAIDQDDAIRMTRRLAAEEGILCGISTGLNVAAAVALAVERGPDAVVVTLGCDSGTKYLDSGIFDQSAPT